MAQEKKKKKKADIPSMQCYLKENYIPKGKKETHEEYCQCTELAWLIGFFSRIVQLDGSSVMGAELSIMSLFRPSSQALNSFL